MLRDRIPRPFVTLFELVRDAIKQWDDDRARLLGSALAFYMVFSLAPLLIIATSVGGRILGRDAAIDSIMRQVELQLGSDAMAPIRTILQNAWTDQSSFWATLLGSLALLWGSTHVFANLRHAMNIAWRIPIPRQRGIMFMVRTRLAAFVAVCLVGLMLFATVVGGTVVAAMTRRVSAFAPHWLDLLVPANFLLSLFVSVAGFTLIFRLIPDAKVAWRDAAVGALVTGVLFMIGKYGVSFYLGRSFIRSAYGAAGSFVVLLIWIYYTAQILFIGASFTYVYANRFGSPIEPRWGTGDDTILGGQRVIDRSKDIVEDDVCAPDEEDEDVAESASEVGETMTAGRAELEGVAALSPVDNAPRAAPLAPEEPPSDPPNQAQG